MSKQKKTDDELLAEFERMLSEGGLDFFSYEEEDFGYYYPAAASRRDSDYGHDFDFEEPPEVPKEARCKHERKRKSGLTTIFWYCPDCKKDLGNI